ncbi:MAG TPA: tRNA (guanine(10)-N(2))-dimethyltransferase [Candidatus Deferrimicrobium sp.]|nr:tRNA (guanine(10)-N(2))-dimethyltransferase [Candidatus Deferrimicrobium sp.]
MKELSFPLISIKEGAANIQIPDMSQYRVPTDAPVFYNFLMEMNRDIAVLAVKTYQERQEHPISVLLPLAATGVRGIRFQLEIPNIDRIIMNDISATAYALIEQNLKLNQLSEKIEIWNDDVINVLNSFAKRGERFDVIDIDPFGSPTRFIDSAIRALKKNSGMICLTATDMAPLCGVNVAACLRKYGGKPLRTEYCHELAVRLCLNTLISTAAKYEIAIQPLLCYSIDHYIRIYALLQSGALKTDAILQKLGYIVHCFQCDYRSPTINLLAHEPNCPTCGAPLDYAGPLWLGEICDVSFCNQLLEKNTQMKLGTKKRIEKLLKYVIEEASGAQTYQNIHRICQQYKLNGIPLVKILQSLHDQGFSATRTHFSNVSIRTNASRTQIANSIKQISL